MKDHVTVTQGRATSADGVVGPWQYTFACQHCPCCYKTAFRWRIMLSLRMHKFVCPANTTGLSLPDDRRDDTPRWGLLDD